ncbi:hypothetical protein [Escherichia phage PJNS034]
MKKIFTTVTILAGLFASSANAFVCTGTATHKDGGTADIIVNTNDMVFDDAVGLYRAETQWHPKLASTLYVDQSEKTIEGVGFRGMYTAVAVDSKDVIMIADDLVCYE